jgi:hypothetical protein
MKQKSADPTSKLPENIGGITHPPSQEFYETFYLQSVNK